MMATMTSFHAEKCRHLLIAHAASAGRICRFLIHSTCCFFISRYGGPQKIFQIGEKPPHLLSSPSSDSLCCAVSLQSAVLASVRPAVCHTLVSCQIDSSYDHAVFTVGQSHDSNFLTVNFSAKFQGEHRERGRRMRGGRKNRQFLANKSPCLRNGARCCPVTIL